MKPDISNVPWVGCYENDWRRFASRPEIMAAPALKQLMAEMKPDVRYHIISVTRPTRLGLERVIGAHV